MILPEGFQALQVALAGCSSWQSLPLPTCHTPSTTAPVPGLDTDALYEGQRWRCFSSREATTESSMCAYACVWIRRMTHRCDSGELSAGAEQAALQQVSLLDDTLHGGRVIRAHLYLLAGWQQRRLQGVLTEHATYQTHVHRDVICCRRKLKIKLQNILSCHSSCRGRKEDKNRRYTTCLGCWSPGQFVDRRHDYIYLRLSIFFDCMRKHESGTANINI